MNLCSVLMADITLVKGSGEVQCASVTAVST